MARRPTLQKKTSKPESKGKLMSFETRTKGQQKEPKPPFPKQHQHPGIEADVAPAFVFFASEAIPVTSLARC